MLYPRIKFADIRIGPTAKKLVNQCLDDNWVTKGKLVEEFEQRWAKLCGAKYAVAVNSGTSADIAACLALWDVKNAQPGDEVIIPALSFVATYNAPLAAGLQIRPVDIDLDNLSININAAYSAINKRTISVMPVALMGCPYQADYLSEMCQDNDLLLMSDSCESHLCKYDGEPLEKFADVCMYSYYTAHLAFACQFGSLTTNCEDIQFQAKSIRNHGRNGDDLFFSHARMGLNLQPTDVNAAIGLEGLDNIQETFDIRKKNLNIFLTEFQKYKDKIWMVEEQDGNTNSPHALSITFKKEGYIDRFREHLENKYNIETKRNFGAPTQHKAFRHLPFRYGDFPNAEWVGEHGLHLPVHQYLDSSDITRIIEAIHTFFNNEV